MKFITAILSFLCATLASSSLVVPRDDAQQVFRSTLTGSSLAVPGDNPLQFCANPKSYKVKVEFVDLDPNPPKPGQDLTISGAGNFTRDITNGAKVDVSVSWGLITLIHKKLDLCSNLPEIGLKCPLKKGHLSFNKTVTLPSIIPPGSYEAKANVVDKYGRPILCMKAALTFGL